MKNRLGSHLIGPKWTFWKKIFWVISPKKFGSVYAQSPRKCSNFEILAKIEGKEAKFFLKIYLGNIRIWFLSKKNSKLSHACVPLRPCGISSLTIARVIYDLWGLKLCKSLISRLIRYLTLSKNGFRWKVLVCEDRFFERINLRACPGHYRPLIIRNWKYLKQTKHDECLTLL